VAGRSTGGRAAGLGLGSAAGFATGRGAGCDAGFAAGRTGIEPVAGLRLALASDEGRTTGGATLLGVVGHQHATVLRETVDVGRGVAHHALVKGADVEDSDIIARDDKDVGLFVGRMRRGERQKTATKCGDGGLWFHSLV